MKLIFAVLAVAWMGIAVMYAVVQKDKELSLLSLSICLQYQIMLYQRHKDEEV